MGSAGVGRAGRRGVSLARKKSGSVEGVTWPKQGSLETRGPRPRELGAGDSRPLTLALTMSTAKHLHGSKLMVQRWCVTKQNEKFCQGK